MRRIILIIVGIIGFSVSILGNTIEIPLTRHEFTGMPMDGPTGSTPDPTDPNQFRASLTGRTLHIETQKDAVSYVIISETESEKAGEDYFFGLSYGSIECPITRPGLYIIRIGYWKTDFVGQIRVIAEYLYDFSGHLVQKNTPGNYILRLDTSLGVTCSKICVVP